MNVNIEHFGCNNLLGDFKFMKNLVKTAEDVWWKVSVYKKNMLVRIFLFTHLLPFLLLVNQTLGNVEYSFIAVASRSALDPSGNIWYGPINRSNRTVWHLNSVLMLNWIFEIELFHHLNKWLMLKWIVSDT